MAHPTTVSVGPYSFNNLALGACARQTAQDCAASASPPRIIAGAARDISAGESAEPRCRKIVGVVLTKLKLPVDRIRSTRPSISLRLSIRCRVEPDKSGR